MRKIDINDIRIDGGTQGREVIDQATVYSYRDSMKEGDEFPRLFTVFDGATYWLVDGFHRYQAMRLLGIKQVEVDYKPGTMEEAQVLSFGQNGKHGKPRTNADKRKIVLAALEHPLTKHKSNNEIAAICCVSTSFVSAIKNPDAKQKQRENLEKHFEKKRKSKETIPDQNSQASSLTTDAQQLNVGMTPDDEEMKATELAIQQNMEIINKMLDEDDALKVAYEEIQRLTHQNSLLSLRIDGLMVEKNSAIDMVKKLQKENDKLKGKK